MDIRTDLITGTDIQFEENWEVKMSRGGHYQWIAQYQNNVVSAKHVHLGRSSQESNGRHETGRKKCDGEGEREKKR